MEIVKEKESVEICFDMNEAHYSTPKDPPTKDPPTLSNNDIAVSDGEKIIAQYEQMLTDVNQDQVILNAIFKKRRCVYFLFF